MPRQTLTLPEFDQELAGLAGGSMRRITRCDYEHLFGLNDVALGRLRNFARSHACVASFAWVREQRSGERVAQALIACNWRGLASKSEFTKRQETDPLVLSLGIEDQRAMAVST